MSNKTTEDSRHQGFVQALRMLNVANRFYVEGKPEGKLALALAITELSKWEIALRDYPSTVFVMQLQRENQRLSDELAAALAKLAVLPAPPLADKDET